MARQNREMTPDDLPTGQRPSIDMTNGMADRAPEQILLVDTPMQSDYADELKFMEETVLIRMEKPVTDEKPVVAYPFSVNGRTEWVPTDRPWPVKRKHLEVMLRSQPFRVQTEDFKPGDRDERNLMHRYQSRRFSISILRDPNPRGPDWAQRVALEA